MIIQWEKPPCGFIPDQESPQVLRSNRKVPMSREPTSGKRRAAEPVGEAKGPISQLGIQRNGKQSFICSWEQRELEQS